MLPIMKPMLILGAVIGALLLVQTIRAPYVEQLSEARESIAIQGEQTKAAAESTAAAKQRAERAQARKEEATDAAEEQSDFDDTGPSSLITFLQRLLDNDG